LVRTPPDTPSPAERAARANERGAEVFVSVHLNAHEDPKAEGALCFFYGREDYVSRAGQRLAELIQEELTTRLGLKDGRTHPKALPSLRETVMPAVHVEPCYITNPREEAMLLDERFRLGVARAVASALEGFFRSGLGGSGSARPSEHQEQDSQRRPQAQGSSRA
jgi:N-acetylmuramoyl-L-alanine amidase